MKLNYFKQFVLGLAITASFISCKEDELEMPVTIANVAGTYKLTALTQKTALTPETSILNELEACNQDDTYQLKADGSAVYTDAGTTCQGSAGTYTFSWEVVNKVINITDLELGNGLVYPGGEVKKFDGTTIVLAGKVKNESTGNIEFTITATLVKQ